MLLALIKNFLELILNIFICVIKLILSLFNGYNFFFNFFHFDFHISKRITYVWSRILLFWILSNKIMKKRNREVTFNSIGSIYLFWSRIIKLFLIRWFVTIRWTSFSIRSNILFKCLSLLVLQIIWSMFFLEFFGKTHLTLNLRLLICDIISRSEWFFC